MSDDEGGSEPRNKSVTMYYTADEKAAIKREADEAGKTVSAYCKDIIDRARRAEDLEELDAEQRLERIMAEGTDRVDEIAEDVREQNGLVIHLLREIEDQLEGVDVDTDTETVEETSSGSDLNDRLGR